MFAVIETGGKQYLVKEGDTVKIEKLTASVGDKVVFDKVLLTADEDGGNVKIGNPYLDGASIEAAVELQGRSKKIRVVKYKRKIRYRRTLGHRQEFSKIKIAKV